MKVLPALFGVYKQHLVLVSAQNVPDVLIVAVFLFYPYILYLCYRDNPMHRKRFSMNWVKNYRTLHVLYFVNAGIIINNVCCRWIQRSQERVML